MPTQRLKGLSIWLLCAWLLLQGCLQPPEYPIGPELVFLGLSRDTMIQGATLQDSISVFFSFTDGDGDIAFPASDTTPSVFISNRRTGEVITAVKLDPIDENGIENGISGELRVLMYTTCCDYPPFVLEFPCTPSQSYPIDTLLLEAYMRDRAGNESERVELSPVYLICNRI